MQGRQVMNELLANPLFGVVVGAAVTWLTAWYYYKRAGDELRREAQKLQTATRAIVYMLENPDAKITVRRDGDGNATGLVVSASGTGLTPEFSPERE